MDDLTPQDVQALGRAVGFDIEEPHLSEVTHNINALRDMLNEINPPGIDQVEPLPIIHPYRRPNYE